jgi:hypothetical protein
VKRFDEDELKKKTGWNRYLNLRFSIMKFFAEPFSAKEHESAKEESVV